MVAWIVTLDEARFSLAGHAFSVKDLIMLAGGLFLVWKATSEIHHKVDPDPEKPWMEGKAVEMTMTAAIGQIVLLDAIFSIDSIITAVGMTPHLPLMVIAVSVAIAVMLLMAEPLGAFLDENPTVLMLALGFLLMIGMTLMAEGFGFHVPKGYIYAAMAFSGFVEALNVLARRRRRRARESG
jgi:predicted tellurium resistance membrane protein TerC